MSTASRKWVKVWHEILTDTTFLNLSLEQQARFYHLLVYVSQHGDRGVLTVEAPARYLLTLMQCANYDELVTLIAQLPNVQIVKNSHANFSVTIKGWSKYQIDSTACIRKRNQRKTEMSRPKIREEKKRKEEDKEKIKKIGTPDKPATPSISKNLTDEEFLKALKTNPAYKGIDIDLELARMDAWLLTPKGRRRKKTRVFVVNWLNRCDKPIQEGGNGTNRANNKTYRAEGRGQDNSRFANAGKSREREPP